MAATGKIGNNMASKKSLLVGSTKWHPFQNSDYEK